MEMHSGITGNACNESFADVNGSKYNVNLAAAGLGL